MVQLIEVTLIIPTLKREKILLRTIESFAKQSYQPSEIIIVDATTPFKHVKNLESRFKNLKSKVLHVSALSKGAAAQRNEGVNLSKTPFLAFCDDDIILEKDCFKNLWYGLIENPSRGGVNAVMTNQTYHEPGIISRTFYNFLNEEKFTSYAGKCFGPAIAFYPKGSDDNSKDIEVDWLNLGFALYRREALPVPVFDEHFTGYSLMEDLALSLKVAKAWKLFAIQTAKIYHDSQPGDDKDNLRIFSEMDLVNRYFIMKYILHKNSFSHKCRLFLQQVFSAVCTGEIIEKNFWTGKLRGLQKIRTI